MRWLIAIATLVTGAVATAVTIVRRPQPIELGEPPACNLPPRTCTSSCDELVEMPVRGPGYVDDRYVAETISETSSSYLRRDMMLLVQYAAAKVACQAAAWNTGIGGPIMLGDMSERDGATPGTLWGRARHPLRSHEHGFDIDIAYFQTGTPNNRLRPVCRHRNLLGEDQYRCLAPPERLDAWRTALLIGAFLEEPRLRVIGVDGRIAPPILRAFDDLCAHGWIEPVACRRTKIQFERRNRGRGWFRSHHNHLHVSLSSRG